MIDEEMEVVEGGGEDDDGDKDLNDYELWREMKKTVKALREDMGSKSLEHLTAADGTFLNALALEREEQAPNAGPGAFPVGRDPGPGSMSMRPLKHGSVKQQEEPHRFQGKIIKVDDHGLPIILEDNTFMFTPEEGNV